VRWTIILVLVCAAAFAASTSIGQSTARKTGDAADPSAAQNVTQRLSDLPASQRVALSFSDLNSFKHDSPSAISSPAVQPLALGHSEPSANHFAPSTNDSETSASRRDLLHRPDNSKEADNLLSLGTALPTPPQPVSLIGFQVVPALPPIGHSRFCVHYPQDCKVHGLDFRKRNVTMTSKRLDELNRVNRDVNNAIWPVDRGGTDTTAEWAISPPSGDCKSYAVTKRHELLARGWPSRGLLLSDVVLPSGEHHLLLVVRLKDANVVLDNLSNDIRLVAMTYDRYQWTRIQSPLNPALWMGVQNPTLIHAVDLDDGGNRSR
jgi:predicted transglutaminase-like cysteine proteinase